MPTLEQCWRDWDHSIPAFVEWIKEKPGPVFGEGLQCPAQAEILGADRKIWVHPPPPNLSTFRKQVMTLRNAKTQQTLLEGKPRLWIGFSCSRGRGGGRKAALGSTVSSHPPIPPPHPQELTVLSELVWAMCVTGWWHLRVPHHGWLCPTPAPSPHALPSPPAYF